MCVAEGCRSLPYPVFRLLLVRQVGQGTVFFFLEVAHGGEVGIMLVLPTIFKFLGRSAATLRETCVANLVVIHQQLPTGGLYGFCHRSVRCFRDALITLAMVVGAHVEDGVVLTVIPTNVFVLRLDERKETIALVAHRLAFLYLGEKPASRNHGVRLQQLQ